MGDLTLTYFASAASAVWVIEQLKRIQWLKAFGSGAWRIISIVWAIASTVIVSWQYAHSLELTTIATIAAFLWHLLEQFSLQEVIYRATRTRST